MFEAESGACSVSPTSYQSMPNRLAKRKCKALQQTSGVVVDVLDWSDREGEPQLMCLLGEPATDAKEKSSFDGIRFFVKHLTPAGRRS